MAKIYYELIKKGLKTLEDVPEKLKKQVRELMESDSNNWDFLIFQEQKRGEGSAD